MKLAAELGRGGTGSAPYVRDEPTTGLHIDDVGRLIKVLHGLVELGHTVVVIEQSLEVVKRADWVIDMGPEEGQAEDLSSPKGPRKPLPHVPRARRANGYNA